MSRKPARRRSWKGRLHALVAIRGGPLPFGPSGDPRLTLGNRYIQDQGQVGDKVADRQLAERGKRFLDHALPVPLVGRGRIDESVTDDPAARRKRWRDGPDDVLVARRVVQ